MQLQKLMILLYEKKNLASAQVITYWPLKVNRFLHIAESAQDLVLQNKMQRKIRSKHWNMFPEMCGNGCIEFFTFYYI